MHTKTLLRSAASLGAVSFFLCVLGASFPAQAGFQWIPPEQASQVPQAPLASPAPVPATPSVAAPSASVPVLAPQPEILPQIIEAPAVIEEVPPAPVADLTFVSDPMPVPEASAEPGTITTPVLMPASPVISPAVAPSLPPVASAPLVMEDAPMPIPSPAGAGPDKIVLGFANNVPLSVALRQVLPSDYAYSVAQDVSLGTLVSWRGGDHWRKVLQDMLLPAGLAAKEEGLLVEVVATTPSLGLRAGTELAAPPASGALAPLPPLPIEESAVALPFPAPEPPPETKYPSMGYLKAPDSVIAPPVSLTAPFSPDPQIESVDVWTVQRGETLRDALEKWASRAHVDLSWQSEYDYPLQANISFNGPFEDAVRSLLTGLQDAKPQPIGKLHKNQEAGQTVLVIQARGNNYNN